MTAAELLECLEKDSMARLRHAIMREAGISPLSLRAGLISNRRVLKYACHLALDSQAKAAGAADAFDMQRFLMMKEGEHEGI